jgi:hypothetical protein
MVNFVHYTLKGFEHMLGLFSLPETSPAIHTVLDLSGTGYMFEKISPTTRHINFRMLIRSKINDKIISQSLP